MIKAADKKALIDWDRFVDNMNRAAPVDLTETPVEKAKRIAWLEKEGNDEEWFKYYFSNHKSISKSYRQLSYRFIH